MKILVIKLSSLGDVLHLLPALSDLHRRFPAMRVDWAVEPAFAEVPGWHPAVERSIPVGLRRLKRHWWRVPGRFLAWRRILRGAGYSRVIDAQGLAKSALLARLAGAPVFGLDRDSAREPLASRFYVQGFPVSPRQHAVARNRQLLAQIMDYACDDLPLDYGLAAFAEGLRAEAPGPLAPFVKSPFVLGLHGTTWASKHWPERYWLQFGRLCAQHGLRLLLPWGSGRERERAQRLQAAHPDGVQVLPRLAIRQLAQLYVHARAFVGVDSGLSHLGAALDVPGVSLYGPTAPGLTGVFGARQAHLASDLACAPCLLRDCPLPPTPEGMPPCQAGLTPEAVMERLLPMLGERA